ncbi:MAG: hypothetical protein QOG87_10 [Actinomycetota bacterium]
MSVEGEDELDDLDQLEDDDEIVFELRDWREDERARLGEKLEAGGIAHEWEDGDLVVADADADRAEAAIEAIEYPDELPADGDGEPAEDEGSYEIMSALFVAADRLQHDPDDPVIGGEFDVAAETAGGVGPPYGFDAQVWRQVQELAANVCDQLDDADADVIARDAGTLRQLLSRYV